MLLCLPSVCKILVIKINNEHLLSASSQQESESLTMVSHRQEAMTTSRYTAKMTFILGKYSMLAFVCTGKLKYKKKFNSLPGKINKQGS